MKNPHVSTSVAADADVGGEPGAGGDDDQGVGTPCAGPPRPTMATATTKAAANSVHASGLGHAGADAHGVAAAVTKSSHASARSAATASRGAARPAAPWPRPPRCRARTGAGPGAGWRPRPPRRRRLRPADAGRRPAPAGRRRGRAGACAGCTGRQHAHHDQQAEGDAERAEQRQEDVVEGEDLVAQHGQPVEHLGSLVLLDADGRGLQPGDVGLEADGEALAEPLRGAGRRRPAATQPPTAEKASPTPATTSRVRSGSPGVRKRPGQQPEPQGERGRRARAPSTVMPSEIHSSAGWKRNPSRSRWRSGRPPAGEVGRGRRRHVGVSSLTSDAPRRRRAGRRRRGPEPSSAKRAAWRSNIAR